MTRFHRSGHYRRTSQGVTWVTGHSVSRDDWYRSHSDPDSLRALACQFEGFLRPNARCPVCGAPVFYVEPAQGGRVFFDELGPPWPKHPCTEVDPEPAFNELPDASPAWVGAGWRPARIKHIDVGPDRAALHFEDAPLFGRMDVPRDHVPRLLGLAHQRRVADPASGVRDEVSVPAWPNGTPVVLTGPTGVEAVARGTPDVRAMTDEDAAAAARAFVDNLDQVFIPESVEGLSDPLVWVGFRAGRPRLVVLFTSPHRPSGDALSLRRAMDAATLWLRLLACAPATPRADVWADFDRRAEAWDRRTAPEVVLVSRDPLLAARGIPGFTSTGFLVERPHLSYEIHELTEANTLIHRSERLEIDPVQLHAPMHEHARLLHRPSPRNLLHASEVRGVRGLFELLQAALPRHGLALKPNRQRLDIVGNKWGDLRGHLCLGASGQAIGIVIAMPEQRAGPPFAIHGLDDIDPVLERL